MGHKRYAGVPVTVHGTEYKSFNAACIALGLNQSTMWYRKHFRKQTWQQVLEEASTINNASNKFLYGK